MNQGKAHVTNIQMVVLGPGIEKKNDDHLHQTAPENAISALNALVLFSVLSPAFIPSRIPTMITRTSISPTEETVNEMFETLFLDKDSKAACSSALEKRIRQSISHSQGSHLLVPCRTSSADVRTSGRWRVRPGNAAVQNVRAPYLKIRRVGNSLCKYEYLICYH